MEYEKDRDLFSLYSFVMNSQLNDKGKIVPYYRLTLLSILKV